MLHIVLLTNGKNNKNSYRKCYSKCELCVRTYVTECNPSIELQLIEVKNMSSIFEMHNNIIFKILIKYSNNKQNMRFLSHSHLSPLTPISFYPFLQKNATISSVKVKFYDTWGFVSFYMNQENSKKNTKWRKTIVNLKTNKKEEKKKNQKPQNARARHINKKKES